MNLFDKISEDIKDAMRAKDKVRLEALRGIKKEFIEAKTAKGGSEHFTDDAAILILQKMVKQRKDSAAIYHSQARHDLAEREIEEASVIEEYLPKQLSPVEIVSMARSLVRAIS